MTRAGTNDKLIEDHSGATGETNWYMEWGADEKPIDICDDGANYKWISWKEYILKYIY